MAAVTSAYARAFTDVVLEKRLDGAGILQQLHALSATLAESLELRRVLQNPSIPAPQKRGLLDVIVSREKISPPVRNFAAVLIDHRRSGTQPGRAAGVGSTRAAVDREESESPLCAGWPTSRRSCRQGGEHHLRRFCAGSVGEDPRADYRVRHLALRTWSCPGLTMVEFFRWSF